MTQRKNPCSCPTSHFKWWNENPLNFYHLESIACDCPHHGGEELTPLKRIRAIAFRSDESDNLARMQEIQQVLNDNNDPPKGTDPLREEADKVVGNIFSRGREHGYREAEGAEPSPRKRTDIEQSQHEILTLISEAERRGAEKALEELLARLEKQYEKGFEIFSAVETTRNFLFEKTTIDGLRGR